MLPIDRTELDREAFFKAFRIKSQEDKMDAFDEAREILDRENRQAVDDQNHMMGL